jgi:hypothetical protein
LPPELVTGCSDIEIGGRAVRLPAGTGFDPGGIGKRLGVVFTAVHVAAIVADSYVHFGLVDVLVPLAATWHPLAVAWGIVGLYLLLAVEITSLRAPACASEPGGPLTSSASLSSRWPRSTRWRPAQTPAPRFCAGRSSSVRLRSAC